jgi:beta-glucosidase
VSEKTIDNRARAVLELVKLAQAANIPQDAPERELDRPEDRALLRQVAADSIVLLKNTDNVLPLREEKQVAIIGPNARIATYCGGGSASLNAYRTVTPFDAIQARAKGGLHFAQGSYGHQMLPQLGESLKTPDGRNGFTLRFYNDPSHVQNRRQLEERHLTDSYIFFIDYDHPDLQPIWYAEAEGTFVAEESGTYDFGLAVQGTGILYVNGKQLIRNVEDQRAGSSFLGVGTVEETAALELEAGKAYDITVQWACAKTSTRKVTGTVDFGHGGLRFGGCKRLDRHEAIKDAVQLAKSSEQVILFAGLSGEWESEGDDRTGMDLPPGTDELISRVLDANADTVVVLQSGTPVTMPWADKAKAIVHAWYGGNETGHGIADVLFGDVNPVSVVSSHAVSERLLTVVLQSGKLPLTFPRRLKDNPAYLNYRSEGGRVLYGEDVYVGYRYYEQVEVEPLFRFGHGLSYTTFMLSKVSLDMPDNGRTLAVHCSLTNTGSIPGAEVVQVYVAPVSTSIRRPVKELKGFKKIWLKAGGTASVNIELDTIRDTSFWSEKRNEWRSEKGKYRIVVGIGSNDDLVDQEFELDQTVYWSGL